MCKEYAQMHLFVSKEGNDCLYDEKTPAHKIKQNQASHQCLPVMMFCFKFAREEH